MMLSQKRLHGKGFYRESGTRKKTINKPRSSTRSGLFDNTKEKPPRWRWLFDSPSYGQSLASLKYALPARRLLEDLCDPARAKPLGLCSQQPDPILAQWLFRS